MRNRASSNKVELRRKKHIIYMKVYYSKNKVYYHEFYRKKRPAEKVPKKFSTMLPKRPILLEILQKFEKEGRIET